MTEAVLDTSAVLAFLRGESGGELVGPILGDCAISSVNLAEVITKLIDRGSTAEQARQTTETLSMNVVAATLETAALAGMLHARTRGRGVSLGDRFCLALAMETGLPVYTADRAWAELGLDLDIRLIR
ncbi:type II toxin-antitoxin system VapC family toxin [Phenylobacterium montanum]|uniref:Type II toxin-antitoxin system VapC family toxin n=1 Tax=Phenylobacterium montanum TaxID=2823693 RepID=A0A975FZX5_9CAUL|nr:type II toxin-antitoxin system VapC family toxin [Caulobacter sp. S6]QUD87416.1 type II toxin-antitoxin system VapC family toxin [Caulobacter sp. S6]